MRRALCAALVGTLIPLGGCLARPEAANDEPFASDPAAAGRLELGGAIPAVGAKHKAPEVLVAGSARAEALLAAAPVQLDARAGSFVVLPVDHHFVVIGRDASGAMYGAFELAERARKKGGEALLQEGAFAAAPAIALRGANLFLTLPDGDGASWWFHDVGFWKSYLTMLARARINFLDLHGMYNPRNTIFPNALLYFARSASFPDVGAPAAERERNLEMLRTVVSLARARGIEVGLMSYHSDTSLYGDGSGPRLSDEALRVYTREAAADLARRVPQLRRIGFRIGESGRDAAWYAGTIIEGVQSAGTGAEVYTRTWVTKKSDILALAQAANRPPIVEAKLNGEQLGAPYPIVGGMFAGDFSPYSYEGFLDDPSPPYRFVFQIRSAGTHRIFRQASYERTRRLMHALAATANVEGFSFEAPHAYSPVRDDYHVRSGDRFSDYTFRRDELMYFMFGRLAYDPETPESVFRARLKRRTGTDDLWAPLQAASDIVPLIQTANTCGPDHRDYAPELELGGAIDYWASPAFAPAPPDACALHAHNGPAYHGPFDSFAVASPYELAQDLVRGVATARMTPLEVARRVLDDAAAARAAAAVRVDPATREAVDVARDVLALADLGEWFAHKLRGASALAVYSASGADDYLAAARDEARASHQAYAALVEHTRHIAPFREPLRMDGLGVRPFHWSALVAKLAADDAGLDAVARLPKPTAPATALPPAKVWLDAARPPAPTFSEVLVENGAAGFTVAATVGGAPASSRLSVWYKPYASDKAWRALPMTLVGPGRYGALVPASPGGGGHFALELASDTVAARWPDPSTSTPYIAVAPQ